MTVSNGDILQIRAKMSKGSNDLINVYHVMAAFLSPQSDGDVYDACAAKMDDAYDNLDALMNDGYSFDTIEVVNLTTHESLGEEAWPTLTAGLSNGDNLPMQVSAVLRFPTTTLGSQGRKFLAGFTETENTGSGTLSAALLTALGNYATEIIQDIIVDGANVLMQGNWNEGLSRFAPWISVIVNTLFGTQRRRQAGAGS